MLIEKIIIAACGFVGIMAAMKIEYEVITYFYNNKR